MGWHGKQPVTLSVSVLLSPHNDKRGLILSGERGQWGLPSGSIEEGESLEEALMREVKEETGIGPGMISFRHHELAPRHVVCLPRPEEGRTRLGIIYRAIYLGPRLPRSWRVRDEDIDQARCFSRRELLPLIRGHLNANQKKPSPIREPDFNFPLILTYLIPAGPHNYPYQPRYVEKFLREIKDQVDHLEVLEDRGDELWTYKPTCMYLANNLEAEKRRHGLHWGPKTLYG